MIEGKAKLAESAPPKWRVDTNLVRHLEPKRKPDFEIHIIFEEKVVMIRLLVFINLSNPKDPRLAFIDRDTGTLPRYKEGLLANVIEEVEDALRESERKSESDSLLNKTFTRIRQPELLKQQVTA